MEVSELSFHMHDIQTKQLIIVNLYVDLSQFYYINPPA